MENILNNPFRMDRQLPIFAIACQIIHQFANFIPIRSILLSSALVSFAIPIAA